MKRREFFKRATGAVISATAVSASHPAGQGAAAPEHGHKKEYGLLFDVTEAMLEDSEAFMRHASRLREHAMYVHTRNAHRVFEDAQVVMKWKAR